MEQKWRILNGNPAPHFVAALDSFSTWAEVTTIAPGEEKRIPELLPQYDVYLATLAVRLTPEQLAAAPRLKLIATATTGVDHLPVEEIQRRGIALYTLRQSQDFLSKITSTAELAWGLILALTRHFIPAFRDVCNGQWRRQMFLGQQLSCRTLGIIGYGRLGKVMGRYGLAFGMRVLAYDVNPAVQQGVDGGIEFCSLKQLLAQSDIVTLHIHLTAENQSFFNREKIFSMKRGSLLINTSRGGILDEDALLEALESGQLAGAGLDVLSGEWSNMCEHPVVKYAQHHDNVLITPHCGGASLDAQIMTYEEMLRHVKTFCLEGYL